MAPYARDIHGNGAMADTDLLRVYFKGGNTDNTGPSFSEVILVENGQTLRIGDTIHVRIKATDESGIDRINVTLDGPNVRTGMPVHYNSDEDIYEAEYTFQEGNVNGMYDIMSVYAYDVYGNGALADFPLSRVYLNIYPTPDPTPTPTVTPKPTTTPVVTPKPTLTPTVTPTPTPEPTPVPTLVPAGSSKSDAKNIVVNGNGEVRTVSVKAENVPANSNITISSVSPSIIELIESSRIREGAYNVWFAVQINSDSVLDNSATITVQSNKLTSLPEGAVLYHVNEQSKKVRRTQYTYNKSKQEIEFKTKEFGVFTVLVPVKENTETQDIIDVVPSVSYRTHVQSIGWQGYVKDGEVSGTTGQSKRLEGININLSNLPYSGGITYRTHVQTYGWQEWKTNGEMAGTEGESKRLEAIQIQLTGEIAKHYDIYYQTHIQHFGWSGWASNGEMCGSAGYACRLEGICIKLVRKGNTAPASNSQIFYLKPNSTSTPVSKKSGALVGYNTHVQTYGWQNYAYDGMMAGTSGQSKRLEGIHINLIDKPYSGDIVYRTHVQTYGWQEWKKNGEMSGTSGKSKRLEGIQIYLTGAMAEHYDIYYRVHAQTYGWLDYAKNGVMAGTSGLSKRLEGINIVLVPKGGKVPGATTKPFVVGDGGKLPDNPYKG